MLEITECKEGKAKILIEKKLKNWKFLNEKKKFSWKHWLQKKFGKQLQEERIMYEIWKFDNYEEEFLIKRKGARLRKMYEKKTKTLESACFVL